MRSTVIGSHDKVRGVLVSGLEKLHKYMRFACPEHRAGFVAGRSRKGKGKII